jgi:hypothetical protein
MSGLVSNVHAAAGWVLAAKKGWQARFRAAHDHLSVMRLELLCMSRIVRAMRVVLAGARTVIMATRRPQTRQTCGKLPAPAVRRKRKAAAGNDEGTQAAPTAAPPRKAKPKKKAASVLLPSVDVAALQPKAQRVLQTLAELYPDPAIPLNHTSNFQLLVAVVLSAQVRTSLLAPTAGLCVAQMLQPQAASAAHRGCNKRAESYQA